MEKHRAYHELLERLPRGGCAPCSLVAGGLDHYLTNYLDEGVTDEAAWERLQAARGWCARHARQLEAKADGLAVALFYGHQLGREAAAAESGPRPLARLLRALGADRPRPCPACGRERESELAWTGLLARAAAEAEARARMAEHLQLCVPHLRQSLAQARGEALRFLRRDQAAKLRALAGEAAEFVRKTSPAGRAEGPPGREADSWRRSLRRWYGLGWGA